jgi:hypothetical protein
MKHTHETKAGFAGLPQEVLGEEANEGDERVEFAPEDLQPGFGDSLARAGEARECAAATRDIDDGLEERGGCLRVFEEWGEHVCAAAVGGYGLRMGRWRFLWARAGVRRSGSGTVDLERMAESTEL